MDAASWTRSASTCAISLRLRMDNSDAIARNLARYVALRRTPETMNEALRSVRGADARGYAEGRAQVPGGEWPDDRDADRARPGRCASETALAHSCCSPAAAHGADPHRGAARQIAAGDVPHRVHDGCRRRIPADKPGLAYLTADDARGGRHEGPDVQADHGRACSRWRPRSTSRSTRR